MGTMLDIRKIKPKFNKLEIIIIKLREIGKLGGRI
jgi:hypothetical protein